MEARAFVQLVSDMMTTQANYFRDRKLNDLMESKKLERQVREALAQGITFPDDPKSEPAQPNLFQENNDETQRA